MYTILMVDDERQVLKVRAGFLMEKGCLVHSVTTAKDALGMVKLNAYDCILLDVMLKECTGFVLCEKMRALTDAPIIFLSSLSDDASQLEGFNCGGVDYIPKDAGLPLFWAKVETRIRLYLLGKHTLSYPPLLIDRSTHKVFVDEVEIVMTSLEFDILALVASKPRTLFTLDDIYREVWGADPQFQAQTVQAHLSRMRRKLEKAFPRHYFIETVWGKGYHFIPMSDG